jgi:hypothetical protein
MRLCNTLSVTKLIFVCAPGRGNAATRGQVNAVIEAVTDSGYRLTKP